MDAFTTRGGALHAEEVSLEDVAAEIGTPVYVYSTAAIEARYRALDAALAGALGDRPRVIAYAVKANSNLAVIKTLTALGAGADAVSEGELRRAVAAGAPPAKIVFAGVGKTRDEIAYALAVGIGQFNVESQDELEAIASVAAERGVVAPFAVRVNPDVDPKTHAKISTGKAETKFGVPIGDAPALYARAAALPSVDAIGVDAHIGSQLTEIAPFEAAFERLVSLARALRADGRAIRRVDLGGGLGVRYQKDAPAPPTPEAYAAAMARALGDFDAEVVVEPGRWLVNDAGVLLSRVVYRKQGADRVFLICDAAMNDLLRPALYDAWHDIEPVVAADPGAPLEPVDVVGPICETSDLFAKARRLPRLKAGDLLAIRSAGAYAAAMASEYNTRPLAPEAIVKGDAFAVARPRPTYDEIIGRDKLPKWLSG